MVRAANLQEHQRQQQVSLLRENMPFLLLAKKPMEQLGHAIRPLEGCRLRDGDLFSGSLPGRDKGEMNPIK